jgi:carboxypeptidase family protein
MKANIFGGGVSLISGGRAFWSLRRGMPMRIANEAGTIDRGSHMRKTFALLRFVSLLVMIGVCLLMARPGSAQSIISGEITGTVTDATHAVVPNATVNLLGTETGFSASATTTATGTFRFPLLRPGTYNLSVTANNFRTSKREVVASVGAIIDVSVQLEVGATTETVEVTATAPVLQTENANITTIYNPVQIQNAPNPGGDLTNFALTSPGVVLSTGAGYGNFTAFGMPGTSNQFTINGGDTNDPYNGLNNSGSSNNMLGVNEIQEVALVSNGYSGQYGRGAAVNMNFATKSGGNSFHGNAKWDWNGRYLNANDWFFNANGTPRPFANSNQWGGSFAGPIVKNKLFFFYDNEGLRYVLPAGTPVYIPTTQWASDIQANIDTNSNPSVLAESSIYKTMFTLYAGAPGASAATPMPVGVVGGTSFADGGCGGFSGSSVNGQLYGIVTTKDSSGNPTAITAAGLPCTKTFRSGANNLNKEWLQAIRVDYEVSAKDHISGRFWMDRGSQPTFTDPINPAFNSLSIQPQETGQLTETHTFNSNLVNQFILATSYYSAVFGPKDFAAATAVFPTDIGEAIGGNDCQLADGSLSCMGGELYRYPQGRNVTQYQFVDDVSWTKGNHGLKFGVNFKRLDFADYGPSARHGGQVRIRDLSDLVNGAFAAGGPSSFRQRFSTAGHFQINSYSVGFYGQDEWRIKSNLKVTMSLRLDRNSNETCTANCFSRFAGGFDGISHDINTPYNQSFLAGQSTIFPSLERVVWEPRGGFAWTPGGRNTVVRGGIGIFSDLYPAQLSTNVLTNPPTVTSWTIRAAAGGPDVPFFQGPGITNGVFDQAAANNAALASGYATGGTFASMKAAAGPTFKGPDFYTTPQHMVNPKYTEWNLEIQQAIGSKLVASVNYVGSHGTDELLQSAGLNAYSTTPGFDNLPVGACPGACPDPRFGNVVALTNGGISNYNGLTFSVARKATKGFTGTLSYTYSHSLDDISNGGIDQYSTNNLGDSLVYQVNPQNLRKLNYSSSDYDFRHVFNLNYVWEVPFLSSNRWLGGWTIAGALIRRSGQPYSVVDVPPSNLKNYSATSAYVLADFSGGAIPSCTVSSDQVNKAFACLDPTKFSSGTDFGNARRNSFRGPGYFDTDFTVKKSFRVTSNENGLKFTLGANAYNLLNHRNFATPDNFLSSSTFGTIQTTVTPASSPYGNFQGAAVSGRILQLELEVKF